MFADVSQFQLKEDNGTKHTGSHHHESSDDCVCACVCISVCEAGFVQICATCKSLYVSCMHNAPQAKYICMFKEGLSDYLAWPIYEVN